MILHIIVKVEREIIVIKEKNIVVDFFLVNLFVGILLALIYTSQLREADNSLSK